jgi:hypothetical protein
MFSILSRKPKYLPLKGVKVPLLKGDLGGSWILAQNDTFQTFSQTEGLVLASKICCAVKFNSENVRDWMRSSPRN